MSIVKKYPYYIGIDCGVTTGLAIWSRLLKRLIFVDSFGIVRAMEVVRMFHEQHPHEIMVRIEDARLRKWIPKQKDEKAERGRNRGAGSVMRDAQIWEEFLEHHAIPYELVPPKNNKTKVSADYFQNVTGWPVKTNEHARDSAMLVFAM